MIKRKDTLLQKAKSVQTASRVHKEITDDEIDLAIAWMKKEISATQANTAYGFKPNRLNNVLYRIALALREAYSRGIIEYKN